MPGAPLPQVVTVEICRCCQAQGGQKWFHPRFLGDDRAVTAQTEGKTEPTASATSLEVVSYWTQNVCASGPSLMVQWLRPPRSQCKGSQVHIPTWGIRSHKLQLRVHMPN